jgi:mannan endo-1,4-beta-mannosidase
MVVRSLALSALVAACAVPADESDGVALEAAQTSAAGPSDPAATPETRVVMANLQSFSMGSTNAFDRRVMIGQQEADVSNRTTNGLAPVASDIEAATGRAPALVGYELSHLTKASLTAFDVAAFRAAGPALRERILAQHAKGALVSLVWHLKCPKRSANERDLFAPAECPNDYRLDQLLEGAAHFAEWRAILDELAELLWSLKDARGNLIPIQLRPFHEFTGNWFWWGANNDPSTYARVWRDMVDYLRRGRGLHHLLWVFCPNGPTGAQARFDAFYPGDAYVDVVAFDRYDFADHQFARAFADDLRIVSTFARAHGKVAAVGEVGREMSRQPVDASWFSDSLLAPLTNASNKIAYVTLWRNAPWEKFVPEAGDGAPADDLRALSSSPTTLMSGAHDLYTPLHR